MEARYAVEVSQKLLEEVRYPRELDMKNTDLSSLDPELLTSAATYVKVVNLSPTHLTLQQAPTLCQVLSKNSRLKTLNLCYNALSCVQPELLANVVGKLDRIDLYKTNITPQQVTTLCHVINQNSQLKMDLNTM